MGRPPRDVASLPDDRTLLALVEACALRPGSIERLPAGATSAAWRAETDAGSVVIRVEHPELRGHPRRRRAAFEAELAVLARLRPRDARVPRPIATNRDVAADPLQGALPWSVTEMVVGEPARQDTLRAVAPEVGRLLAALHDLPGAGHGMLRDERADIRGLYDDATSGLLARWPWLWPVDGRPLIAHPAARRIPELLPDLSRMRDPLLRWAAPGPAAVLCHGDLRSEHVLVRDRRLAGVIDFGDAMMAATAWDVAIFAWHEGWDAAAALLEGYTDRRLLREMRLAEAAQLAVAYGLARLERHLSASAAGEQLVDDHLRRLRETLSLALRHVP